MQLQHTLAASLEQWHIVALWHGRFAEGNDMMADMARLRKRWMDAPPHFHMQYWRQWACALQQLMSQALQVRLHAAVCSNAWVLTLKPLG